MRLVSCLGDVRAPDWSVIERRQGRSSARRKGCQSRRDSETVERWRKRYAGFSRAAERCGKGQRHPLCADALTGLSCTLCAMAADHAAVFAALKPVLAKFAKRLAVKADTPTEYTLITKSASPFPQH